MHNRLLPTVLLASVAGLLAAASIGAGTAGASAQKPIAALSGPISDEQRTTYWAYSVAKVAIRSAPNAHARKIGSTRLTTEDGFAEDYLVLAQEVYPDVTWFRIRIPGRPNGRTGWVPEQALGDLNVTHEHLVVDERRLRLTVYEWGRKLFSAPVGIGKPSTPTPTGHYWVREKFAVHPTDPFYGPYAFGTSDYSTLSEWPHGGVVGIHGTNAPWLIPGAPSHGCIRLKNADVSRLWQLLAVGTPITIM
jgi:hypothetical protein